MSHHQFRDIVTGEQDIKEMSFSFLELSKFHKHFDELKDDIDQWAYYFKKVKHISPEKLDKILSQGTIFGEAYKVLEKSAYSETQLLEYTRYELKEEEIEMRIFDAKIEGRIEGEKIGIEKNKIEVTKKMLAKGMDINDVSELSGLSIEEIKRL